MRLIDADALGLEPLTPDIDVSVLFREGFNCAAKQIIEAPTIDPIIHARWIEDGEYQVCSNCGEEHHWQEYRASYCEDCGAKMDAS